MELNGFMIGPEIKMLFKIKVVTVTARHPVATMVAVNLHDSFIFYLPQLTNYTLKY